MNKILNQYYLLSIADIIGAMLIYTGNWAIKSVKNVREAKE